MFYYSVRKRLILSSFELQPKFISRFPNAPAELRAPFSTRNDYMPKMTIAAGGMIWAEPPIARVTVIG